MRLLLLAALAWDKQTLQSKEHCDGIEMFAAKRIKDVLRLDQAPFALPPVFEGEWRVADESTQALLGTRLLDLGVAELKDGAISAMRLLPVSFYPGYILCDLELTRDGEMVGCVSVLYGPTGATALRGSAMPIHMLNMLQKQSLDTDDKRLDYLRFFCTFVHGEGGPFVLVDPGTKLDASADTLKQLEAELKPPRSLEAGMRSAEQVHTYQALVHYSDVIFVADFGIYSDGRVVMENDRPIADKIRLVPQLIYNGALRRLASETAT